MPTFIALLRGINVGGHQKVGMSDLRRMLADLGLGNPRSLLNSGNLLFEAGARSSAALETALEVETARRLGLQTTFFVRTAAEWAQVVARNPFLDAARRDPAHLVVLCLKTASNAAKEAALRAAIVGRETVRTDGRHAYIVYPDGIGRSRLTIDLIEKKLQTRTTARNWNTALRLELLARSPTAGL